MAKEIKQEDKNKKSEFLTGLAAFLIATAIMTIIFLGAFFVIIKNNVGGIADRYRKTIQGIPVLSWALPKPEDPESPEFLTTAQLKEKYEELRKTRDELTRQLEEAERKISE